MENAISGSAGVAARIAAATATRRRRPDYPTEVRALLDAAQKVIAETGRARVADVVAEAGLSNDAFYRHFPTKDALVAALVEEGAERIAVAVARRMARQPSPEAKVRCWLEAMLGQADESRALPTLAVLGASNNFNTAIPTGDHVIRVPLAELLHEPFAALGSLKPALAAELATHAILSRVSGHIWAGTTPSTDEVEYLLDFCVSTALMRRGST